MAQSTSEGASSLCVFSGETAPTENHTQNFSKAGGGASKKNRGHKADDSARNNSVAPWEMFDKAENIEQLPDVEKVLGIHEFRDRGSKVDCAHLLHSE